jgi:hypothetical protein
MLGGRIRSDVTPSKLRHQHFAALKRRTADRRISRLVIVTVTNCCRVNLYPLDHVEVSNAAFD